MAKGHPNLSSSLYAHTYLIGNKMVELHARYTREHEGRISCPEEYQCMSQGTKLVDV